MVIPCLCQASVPRPVYQTRLECGPLFVPCLCTHIHQQPFVWNTFDYSCLFVYKHQSWATMATVDMDHSMLMSGVPCRGNGDGHEHGCLDALAISLWVRRRPHAERSGGFVWCGGQLDLCSVWVGCSRADKVQWLSPIFWEAAGMWLRSVNVPCWTLWTNTRAGD